MPATALSSTRITEAPRLARLHVDTGPVRLLAVATLLALPLIALSLANVGGLRSLWDNLHWSMTALAASIATAWSIRGSTGRARAVRQAGAVAFALWLGANLTWAWLNAVGAATVPSVADILVFATLLPAIALLGVTIRGRMTFAEEIAAYIDSALGFLLIGTILLLIHGEEAAGLPTIGGFVAIAYPTAFIGLGLGGLIGLAAARYPIALGGALALATGAIAVGCAYLGWIAPTVTGSEAGPVPSILFTIGTLTAGFGVATWQDDRNERLQFVAMTTLVSRIVGPIIAGVLFLALLVPTSTVLDGPVRVAVFLGGALFVIRQALLLRERTLTLATISTLTTENGRLVGELRSELERRSADERRMIQASRAAAVGNLAAGVAHEVNNPLTGVLGFAELLIADMEPDDRHLADVRTIRDAALRARAIVRALRDFGNPRPPELAPTDLSELVSQTIDLIRYSIESRGITIDEDLPSLEPIEIDRDAVQQAVLNILTNARQAVADGGRLGVAVQPDGDGRLITVTDDGIGMDAATAQLAFDPFFSGRDEAGVERAAGLGLSVSSGLVESHGGTISIHSRPGRGTTVEIRLPAGRPDRIDEGRGVKVA